MENIYKDRIESLRNVLDENDANWYLCVTADPHSSEYINDHYKVREFLSGFTGSNGDLLVGPKGAWLWTDGRYFVQAAAELEGSGITLMKSGEEAVPTLQDFIRENVLEGDVLMFDGRLIGARLGCEIRDILKKKGAFLLAGSDPADVIWTERPADSAGKIKVLGEELCGEAYREKLKRVREELDRNNCDMHILSSLDDQMWLFNIRGNDIEYNPVAYAYTVIDREETRLYVKEAALSDDMVELEADTDIMLYPYDIFYRDLCSMAGGARVLIDPEYTNYLTLRLLEKSGAKPVFGSNPTQLMKAVKNERECELMRQIYIRDSAILTKFLRYMKTEGLRMGISEKEAADKLDEMRLKDEFCDDLSFTTISACGANAAMMHYEAAEKGSASLSEDKVYLVDSGGQYAGGTTDVTRTLIPADADDTLKLHFTKVCAGMLALQNSVFLRGVSGRNLDIMAREPLWELGIDYKCGTGHGVGYMLNVHEGPQSIRPRKREGETETAIVPGMVVSDEPGVYIEGKYGIRTENILLCVSKTKNGDGEFLCFEPLTYVPIDLDGIDIRCMSEKERKQLNAYHRAVREKLMPYMNEEEKIWLNEATGEV